MSVKRINLSMPPELWAIAKARAKALHFGGNISAYLAHLVRMDSGVITSSDDVHTAATGLVKAALKESASRRKPGEEKPTQPIKG